MWDKSIEVKRTVDKNETEKNGTTYSLKDTVGQTTKVCAQGWTQFMFTSPHLATTSL
jgi:hypothetical protein